jgi:8-oxo-dGTP diphosphatase
VVAAIIRRGDEVILVRQAAPGEEPFWSVPSGQLDEGELLHEALAREVLEETGLRVVGPTRLAFVLQIDNRRPVQLHASRGPGSGYLVTVWTFEVDTFEGVLRPGDPDGFVIEARIVPIADAIARLEATPWLSLTGRYLRGEIESGSLHLQRWHADGRVEEVGRVSPGQAAASGSRQRSPG